MEDLKESLEINQAEINEKQSLEIAQEEKKEVQVVEESIAENEIESITDNIKENSPEVSEDTSSESININNEDANTTNCLALTIQEEHKLTAIKNVFFRSIRMSWKVAVSTITLALIKLFS